MGHKVGHGLGVQQQGTVEALDAGQKRGREGLGFGMQDRAARMRPQYSLMPDAQQIQNCMYDEGAGTAELPSSEEIEYGWALNVVAALPSDVMLSKIVKHEVFLEMKRHRRGAQERLRALKANHNLQGCICHHTGDVRTQATKACLHYVVVTEGFKRIFPANCTVWYDHQRMIGNCVCRLLCCATDAGQVWAWLLEAGCSRHATGVLRCRPHAFQGY